MNVPTVIWDKVSVKYNAERNEKPSYILIDSQGVENTLWRKLWIYYDLLFF